jgi:DNA-binding transcriptional LysR family regulator
MEAVLDLNDLYFFVQVVESKGFSAAGRALGIPKSSLSRRVQQLEATLGVRLLQRTSRRFAVTPVGEEVYQRALAMRIEAEAAESVARRHLAEPSGTVRFTCSIGMAQGVTARLLPLFLERYPKVDLVQHATNRFVDLVEEGFDIGLRGHMGPLADSGLVQRSIAPIPWHLYAAPAYLEAHGVPISPADLAGHNGLFLAGRSTAAVWNLLRDGETEVQVPFTPRLRTDDMASLLEATVAGLGIATMPAYVNRARIETGALRCVLPEWRTGDHRVTLLMPSRRLLLPAVRALADFLAVEFPPLVEGAPVREL